MTKDEALKLALEALEGIRRYGLDTLSGRIDGPDDREWQRAGVNEMTKQARLAITAIKEHKDAYAQPEQEPVAWWNDTGTHIDLNVSGRGTPLYITPPQRTWVGLMRGVRVESDTLVITVKGGNDVARELCGQLINEMETLGNQK